MGFGVGLLILVWRIGDEYQHSDNLYRGLVFLGAGLIAAVAAATSATLFALEWSRLRLWTRLVVPPPIVVAVAAAALLVVVSVWSFQDYAASSAAYETAVQVCGHAPILAQRGFGSDTYMVPGSFDYNRIRYSTHDRFILGGSEYFCTEQDAQAHGYHRFP